MAGGLFSCVCAAGIPVWAVEPAEPPTPQVENLADRVRALEARVRELEQSRSSPVATARPDISLHDSWRQLRNGQSPDEVHRLLGEPQRNFTLDRKMLWYYEYSGVGAGSVLFGEDGKVIGSQEPPR